MTGTTLAHYQILEELGRGGMGVVYRARDTRLDRFVAIKVLPRDAVADPERRRRFVQEAKSASALNHPGIVTIHEISEADGTDFIVMEYVAGKTLAELIPRSGMRLDDALKHAVQIADALATAHAAGIVHRDLKPGNVLVGHDGRLRLVDFGLAKLAEALPEPDESNETLTHIGDGHPRTEEGAILGTAGFMSPEQAEGRAVDARSDIFSFGCLLYQMVSGRRAFRGDSTVSTLGAIIHTEPEPLAADVPRDLQRLIARCLRKEVARRFQHMADVKVALAEIEEESAGQPTRRTAPRRAIGAALLAALVAAVGWAWIERSRPHEATAPLVAVPLTSYPGIEQTPALSPEGNQVAFSWNGEAQDNYDIYVQVIGAEGTVRLTSDPAVDWAPVWSPDGREIRFYRYWREGRFAVMSVPALPGRERTLREYPFAPEMPVTFLTFIASAWSPDGTCTAHTDEAGLLLRLPDGAAHAVGDLPGGSELFPSFSPDGRSLAYVWQTDGAGSDLCVLPLTADCRADGEPRRLTSGMQFVNRPVWTSDGREIVFSAATETGVGLWRIAASGVAPPRRLLLAGGDASAPSLSRDGTRLVYQQTAESSGLWRAGIGSGSPAAERITASTRGDYLPSYSPDGSRIAFSSSRSGSLEIWMADADGSDPIRLTSLGRFSALPEWSPDGNRIVFQSAGETGNDLYVVGAEGGAPRRLTDDPGDEQQPSWSPDGEWIYFMSNRSGAHQIWRVPARGGEAVQVTRGGGEFARVSPDGTELYVARGYYGSLELWKTAAAGGPETRIEAPPIYDWGFVIADGRLYFTTPRAGDGYPVVALDPRSGTTEEVARIGYSPFAKFSVSPDGRWVVWAQEERSNSDLMLVEAFR